MSYSTCVSEIKLENCIAVDVVSENRISYLLSASQVSKNRYGK